MEGNWRQSWWRIWRNNSCYYPQKGKLLNFSLWLRVLHFVSRILFFIDMFWSLNRKKNTSDLSSWNISRTITSISSQDRFHMKRYLYLISSKVYKNECSYKTNKKRRLYQQNLYHQKIQPHKKKLASQSSKIIWKIIPDILSAT